MIVIATVAFLCLSLAFVGTIADWFDARDADAHSVRSYRRSLDAVKRASR